MAVKVIANQDKLSTVNGSSLANVTAETGQSIKELISKNQPSFRLMATSLRKAGAINDNGKVAHRPHSRPRTVMACICNPGPFCDHLILSRELIATLPHLKVRNIHISAFFTAGASDSVHADFTKGYPSQVAERVSHDHRTSCLVQQLKILDLLPR